MKKKRILISILIFAFFTIQIFSQTDNSISADQEELEVILKKCAEYCEKLSSSVLDFICIEKVSEEINGNRSGPNQIMSREEIGGVIYSASKVPRKLEKNSYVYDYQMIRKDNKISNRRILLRENGNKKNEVVVQVKTKRFKYNNLIFGPIALLAESLQHYYEYKIIERKKFKGDEVVIVKAIPKVTNEKKIPFGKLWIRENDYSIVKIEWDQNSLPNPDFFEEDAKIFDSRPIIRIFTEYAYEKNGIRFPSKYSVIETYYRGQKKFFIRSRLQVTYKDYKFFTVKSDWKF